MNQIALLKTITLISIVFLTSGFKNESTGLEGIWVRKADGLVIELKAMANAKYVAQIVQEGAEKFPCDVSGQPIYKNIARQNNSWSCEFLVVEINRCKTEYADGSIRINKKGEMEVNCPGFGKKYYVKKLPRYYRDNEKISL